MLAAFLTLLLGLDVIDIERSGEIVVPIALVLILAGSVITAVCVARLVWRVMSDPAWARWVLSILTFLAVAITYLGLASFGGCLLIAASY